MRVFLELLLLLLLLACIPTCLPSQPRMVVDGGTMGVQEDPQTSQPQSMVQIHQQKLQNARMRAATKALKALAPNVHSATRAFALEHTNLDVKAADELLRAFVSQDDGPRRRAPSRGGRGDAAGARDGDGTKRKHKRRRRHKRADREDETPRYGRYGVLKESDLNGDKRTEFIVWAKEVKQVEIENIARWEERKLFGEFMDAFNTATLPDAKYYDMNAWYYKQAKATAEAARGEAATRERVVFDDEEQRRREIASMRSTMQAEQIQAARRDLLASGKLDMMREQERLRAAQQLAYRTGDMKTARDIAEILAPEEDGKGESRIEFDPKTGTYRKRSKLNAN